MTDHTNTQSQPDSPDFSAGSIVFERFKIIGEIASGAKGRVYKAQDTLLDNTVALKVLLLDHNDRDLVRFQSEARLASKMKHPGIATIFDFGIFGNTPFLSMEFVEGESLESYLEEHHTISILELCEIFLQVCASIDHAHAAGIVHRDIKPANIVISRNEDGTVKAKVLDFGVAKNLDIVEEHGGKLTPTGNLIGSPNYMSPEQCRGAKDLSIKSDNYALGCVMWKCLVGKPPFNSDAVMEVLTMHANVQPEKFIDVLDVPDKLATLIDGLLSKNPDDRPDLKTTVIPVLEELREELTMIFRDASDEADTTDGAKNERTFIDYIRDRKNRMTFVWVLVILILSGVSIYILTTSSGKLDAVPPESNDVTVQADIMENQNIRRLLDSVRKGQSNKLAMSFGYKEKYLVECAGLPGLRRLDLTDTTVSDQQTKHLVRIPNLEALFMNRTMVTTLDGFGDLKTVNCLELKNTQIKNSSLRNVAKMDSLTRLFISNTDIGDDGIKFLSTMKKLEELDLTNTKITSKSADYLKQLPHLRVLRLSKTNIEEPGIREILMMPSLKFVALDQCKAVDATLLATLKQDFPTISFDNKTTFLGKLGSEHAKATANGDWETAYAKIHKIIEVAEKRYGTDSSVLTPTSSMITSFYVTLAGTCIKLGKFAEANQVIARISDFADRTHVKNFQLAALDCQLALADQRKDRKNVIAALEKSIRTQDQMTGVYSEAAIFRVLQLGSAFKDSGEYAKALRIFDMAADRLKSTKQPLVELRSTCKLQHAECFRYLKNNALASANYKEVIQDLESLPSLSESMRGLLFCSYAGLAAIDLSVGNAAAGLKKSDRLIEILNSGKIPPAYQATLYSQRAALLRDLGREKESKACFEICKSIEAEISAKGKSKLIYR